MTRTLPEGGLDVVANHAALEASAATETAAPTDASVAVADALAASGLGLATAPHDAPGVEFAAPNGHASITVDSVRRFESTARDRAVWRRYGLDEGAYVLVVLRRPSGDEDPEQLGRVASALADLAGNARVIFPAHAGTRARLAAAGRLETLVAAGVQCVSPLRYLDLLSLKTGAGAVLTDSGRAVEEAAALGVPCFTIQGSEEARGEVTIEALVNHPRRRRARIGRRVQRVLGIDVDAMDMEETVARCDRLIQRGSYAQHVCINVAKLMSLRGNDELREIVERCDIVSADGQPIVWAARLLGVPLPSRVAGIDLMHELLSLSARKGYRPYILGAKGEVLDEAVEKLRTAYPGLQLAGWRDGYFSDAEAPAVCEEIRASRADLLFVAMGSPKKEYFLGRFGPTLGVPFVMGVGGAIDVAAGHTRRAPKMWQTLGLEWLYRMVQEPRRLARRYITTNVSFLRLVLREVYRTRVRRAPPTSQLAASTTSSR